METNVLVDFWDDDDGPLRKGSKVMCM